MSTHIDKPVERTLTPHPYRAGQSITLRDSNGAEFSVDIIHEYPFTISPAVVVNLHKDGEVHEAVLKLYDRRFSEIRERREPGARPRPQPHTAESEAAFQDFARSGGLVSFLSRLKHADLMWYLYYHRDPIRQDVEGEFKPERERFAEEEARFYHKIQKRYIREVRAYDKLKSLQGRGIPRFFAAVTLQMPSAPLDLDPCYFQVPGILIEKLNGFNLTNLVTELPAGPPDLWAEIIQEATDLATEINRAGVSDDDSQPRNAIVTRREDNTYQVFRIDFGEAHLDSDLKYTLNDDPDYFKKCAISGNDQGALGSVMVGKVKRLTRVKLNIVFDEIWPGFEDSLSMEDETPCIIMYDEFGHK